MKESRIDTFRRYVEKDPKNAFARYSLAMEYRGAGDLDAALATFEALIDHLPDYVPAYLMAAQVAVDLGETERGQAVLHKGIAAAETAGDAHAAGEMRDLLESIE